MSAPKMNEDLATRLEPVPALERLPGREELERIDRHVRSFVTERPVLAVLMALTAGYVVGRIISRAT